MNSRITKGTTGFAVAVAFSTRAMVQPCAATSPAQPFAEAWSQLPGSAGWQMQVSPPFPLDWPPDAVGHGMTVVRYAFAMLLRAGLADGAEMAAPWARSTESRGGAVTVTSLAAELHPLGIQGVRPITKTELDLVGREDEAARLLQAGAPDANSPLIRAATCGWIGRNGLAAAAITPLHPAFERWLSCGNLGSEPAARP